MSTNHYREQLEHITEAVDAISVKLGLSSAAVQQHLSDHAAVVAAAVPDSPTAASQATTAASASVVYPTAGAVPAG